MLAGKRSSRVGDQILKGIADLLLRKVRDPRVKGVTLTGIDLSDDLRYARVYFSLIGGEDKVRQARSGLDSATGYIKRQIGKQVRLRYIPDITFEHDPTLEKGDRIEKILKQIKMQTSEKIHN
jgi:ribosome-binding factor A